MTRNVIKYLVANFLLIFFTSSIVFAQVDTTNQHVQNPINTQPKYAGIAKDGDSKFLIDAIQSNTEEIKMAQLGYDKSANADLKALAMNLKTDHQTLLAELDELSRRKSVTLPAPDSMKVKQESKDLLDSKPESFGTNWIDMMIKSHQQTLEKLQKAQSTISDTDIREWIKNTIPKVESHISQLTELKRKIK